MGRLEGMWDFGWMGVCIGGYVVDEWMVGKWMSS